VGRKRGLRGPFRGAAAAALGREFGGNGQGTRSSLSAAFDDVLADQPTSGVAGMLNVSLVRGVVLFIISSTSVALDDAMLGMEEKL
jgi:hypothetical protein